MHYSTKLTTLLLAMTFVGAFSISNKANASNVMTQSLFALFGAQSACNEHRVIWFAQQCKPGISPAAVRAASIGTMVSAITAGNVASWYSQPNAQPDYERLLWNVGEYLAGYAAAYFYFYQ